MCGRYQLEYGLSQLMLLFHAENRFVNYIERDEIFPTDIVPIIRREDHLNCIDPAKWGLKNPFDSRPLINARGETIDEKKTFKSLFAYHRCIIPATAFYEWRKNSDGSKTKLQISVKDTPIFGMAGLYKTETDPLGNTITHCVIITTSANQAMTSIHERMPVILPLDKTEAWLNNSIHDTAMLKDFLISFDGLLEFTVAA